MKDKRQRISMAAWSYANYPHHHHHSFLQPNRLPMFDYLLRPPPPDSFAPFYRGMPGTSSSLYPSSFRRLYSHLLGAEDVKDSALKMKEHERKLNEEEKELVKKEYDGSSGMLLKQKLLPLHLSKLYHPNYNLPHLLSCFSNNNTEQLNIFKNKLGLLKNHIINDKNNKINYNYHNNEKDTNVANDQQSFLKISLPSLTQFSSPSSSSSSSSSSTWEPSDCQHLYGSVIPVNSHNNNSNVSTSTPPKLPKNSKKF